MHLLEAVSGQSLQFFSRQFLFFFSVLILNVRVHPKETHITVEAL